MCPRMDESRIRGGELELVGGEVMGYLRDRLRRSWANPGGMARRNTSGDTKRLWRQTSQELPKNRMSELVLAYLERVREFIRASAADFSLAQNRDTDAAFNNLALELFALQFNANEPYRRFCLARGVTPEAVDSWRQIPAIATAAFRTCELTLLSPAERTRVFHSSGTTGQGRSRHFHNAASLALYEASLRPWFAHCLLARQNAETRPARRPMIMLTPAPDQAPHSSLAHMLGTVRQAYGSDRSTWTGRVDAQGGWAVDMRLTIQELTRAQEAREPVAVLGTAFGFVQLLDYCAGHQLAFDLPGDSWAMETGGYKGRSRILSKAELHDQIAQRLGVTRGQVRCEYGMCELSSQAYDLPASTVHESTAITPAQNDDADRRMQFPPWARARVISPETGKPVAAGDLGLVQVFDLANVSSAAAVQTEDLGRAAGEGFYLLGRAPEAETRGCSLMAVDTVQG